MASTNDKDERRTKMAEKGLNRMSHITSERNPSVSSSPSPP
ncbi:high affinity nitrate transporter, partial [Corchorus capsularis]